MRPAFIALVLTCALGLGGAAAAAPAAKAKPGGQPAVIRPVEKIKPTTRDQKVQAFLKLVREMGAVPKSCLLKGKRLKGQVQIVTSFPDLKVQKVTSFPDLKVKWVTSFPDQCGLWKKVTSFPDFKIQWVTSFPDLKIQEVTSFPGVP
jgi:hypothetical protein